MSKKLVKIKSNKDLPNNIINMLESKLYISDKFKTDEGVLYYILENENKIKIQMIGSNVEIVKNK